MKSLFNYIISTESRYNNKTNVNDQELILNTEISERDYMFVSRIGTIVNEPAYGVTYKTPRKGDAVIIHHNVFRRWIDIRGEEKNSASFLKENEYYELSSLGIALGDVIGFTPDSEYEFEIEGKKLYRILSNQVTINYGQEKTSN